MSSKTLELEFWEPFLKCRGFRS